MADYKLITFDDGDGVKVSLAVTAEDYEMVVNLVRRLSVHHSNFYHQEEARKRRRAQEQQEAWERFQYTSTHGGFNFSEFFNNYNPRDNMPGANRSGGTRPRPGTGPRPGSGEKIKTHKMLLAEMAGVEWSVADLMDVKKLLKRAQRVCHPDTGGSHDKWLKLQKLQREMGLA